MVSTTITDGNVYLFDGVVSSDNIIEANANEAVTIHAAKIDYDIQNEIGSYKKLVSRGDVGTKEPENKVRDTKKIEKVISVQGYLADEASESATQKRNNIISLMENKGALGLVWGTYGLSGRYQTLFNTSTKKVSVSKVKFTETAGMYADEDVTVESPPERKIDIQIQFVVGSSI